MSDRPFRSLTAAVAAAATPTSTAAPSLATATTLNLARAVMALSASENSSAAAVRAAAASVAPPTGGPALPSTSIEKALPAVAKATPDCETPLPPAAAVCCPDTPVSSAAVQSSKANLSTTEMTPDATVAATAKSGARTQEKRVAATTSENSTTTAATVRGPPAAGDVTANCAVFVESGLLPSPAVAPVQVDLCSPDGAPPFTELTATANVSLAAVACAPPLAPTAAAAGPCPASFITEAVMIQPTTAEKASPSRGAATAFAYAAVVGAPPLPAAAKAAATGAADDAYSRLTATASGTEEVGGADVSVSAVVDAAALEATRTPATRAAESSTAAASTLAARTPFSAANIASPAAALTPAGSSASTDVPISAAATAEGRAGALAPATVSANARESVAGRGVKRATAGDLSSEETAAEEKCRAGDTEEGTALLARLLQHRSCLIITDVQNDFCEGGSLGGSGRRAVIKRINQLRCLSLSVKWKQQKQKALQLQQRRTGQQKVVLRARGDPVTFTANTDAKSASAPAAEAAQGGVEGAAGAVEEEAALAATEGETSKGKERPGGVIDALFDLVVVSQDWHPPDHASFASNHSSSCEPQACRCGDSPHVSYSSLIPSPSAGAAVAALPGELLHDAAAAGGAVEGGGESSRREGEKEDASFLMKTIQHQQQAKEEEHGKRQQKRDGQQKKETTEQQLPHKQATTTESAEFQQPEQDPQHLQLRAGKRVRRAETKRVLDLWPVHCVQHSFGAELHPALLTTPADIYIKKGTRRGVENYSCFGSSLEDTGLTRVLQRERIEVVVIVGFTTEYCVRATAFSALHAAGIRAVYVLTDCCCSIDPEQQESVFRSMRQRGVQLCLLQQLLEAAR